MKHKKIVKQKETELLQLKNRNSVNNNTILALPHPLPIQEYSKNEFVLSKDLTASNWFIGKIHQVNEDSLDVIEAKVDIIKEKEKKKFRYLFSEIGSEPYQVPKSFVHSKVKLTTKGTINLHSSNLSFLESINFVSQN